MAKAKYIAVGAFVAIVALFVATFPISYVVLMIAVNELFGAPCGGLC